MEQIVSVKVPPGRGCGFVQYATKEAAEVAITQMNGTVINGVKVRCAWGRSAAVRAQAAASGGGSYYQQYGYNQQYNQVRSCRQVLWRLCGVSCCSWCWQSYYGYGAGYYQQYQQGGGYGGYAGYGNYAQAQGYQPQQGQHQGQQHHGHYNGHGRHQQNQSQERDFTRPDDVEAMNRRYASQRAYQVE